jgi:hypothetical protein
MVKAVEVGRTNDQLNVDFRKLPGKPVKARFVAHATAGGIEVEHQRFTTLRIAPVRPARLGQ